jgi:hypothetical protein
LIEIKKSINFEYVDEWIIVYDGNKIESNPCTFQGNNKLKEYVYKGEDISGNPQRNYALTKITKSEYFIILFIRRFILHPNLYTLLDNINSDKIYRFNQYNRIKGNNINVGFIDRAMVIITFNLCKNAITTFNLCKNGN